MSDLVKAEFNDDQVGLLKRTICKGATDDEFLLFVSQCQRTGLDPFARQIHAVKRWDAKQQREVMTIQTGIDGYRLIADRTGLYAGNDEPKYDREDGDHPNKATVTVWKIVGGQRVPFTRSARWSEFCQTAKDGKLTRFWQRMPWLMLGKVAEALALRAAFPQELSGIYTNEEMQQADDAETTGPVSAPVTQPEPVKQIPPKPEADRAAPLGRLIDAAQTEADLRMVMKSVNTEAKAGRLTPQQIAELARKKDAKKSALGLDAPPERTTATTAAGERVDLTPRAEDDTDTEEPTPRTGLGKDLAQAILANLTELGIDWTEVRDDHGKGVGLSLVAGFTPGLDLKVTDLYPEQGLKLNKELAARVAVRRDKIAKRNAGKDAKPEAKPETAGAS